MAELVKEQPQEVEISPVGNTKKGGATNKDGFVAGQIVGNKEYQLYMAQQRQKAKK